MYYCVLRMLHGVHDPNFPIVIGESSKLPTAKRIGFWENTSGMSMGRWFFVVVELNRFTSKKIIFEGSTAPCVQLFMSPSLFLNHSLQFGSFRESEILLFNWNQDVIVHSPRHHDTLRCSASMHPESSFRMECAHG